MKLSQDEKEEKWTHSACSMCLSAPMKVKVKNGRITEVRGEDIPGWNGLVCGKAIAGIGGRVYAPDRILYPLKRAGERGEAKFARCTWEDVIDAVAAKLKDYRNAGHPEYFEIWWGCPLQQDNVFFIHYWSAVMRSGISYMHGQVCFGDQIVEKMVTYGTNHGARLLTGVADWARMKYAVIAGHNFPGTSQSSGASCNITLYPLINSAKENGAKFIILDPKLTDTTPWCDDWVPLTPGQDAILALSVAHVLIKEKLYDEDFLLRYTNAPQLIRDDGQALKDEEGQYLVWDEATHSAKAIPEAGKDNGLTLGLGRTYEVMLDGGTARCVTAFQKLAQEVENYPPEITDFPKKTVEIARNLGNRRPSVIFFPGFTSGRYPNEFQTRRAYSAVNLLLGNFDKPGGIYFTKHPFDLGSGWPEPPEVPEYPDKLKLVPGPFGHLMSINSIDREPCYGEPREFHPSTQALPWLHFDAIEQGRLRAVLSTAENSAVTQTNSKWVEQCLKKLDLVIVGDQVPKEFIDLADYVIPEASYMERYHLYSHDYLGPDDKEHSVLYMRSAAIQPQGESKPLSWFLVEVAKRVGMGEYFEKLDLNREWWDRMLKNAGLYPKVTADKLIDEGPYVEDHPITYDLLFKPIATRSRRFEIYSNELAEECYYNPRSKWFNNKHVHPMPRFVSIAEPRGPDQFYLISGKATWHQKSATQHNRYLMEDAIEGDCSYTAIWINADRAKKLGIENGDLVEVECVGPTKGDDPCVFNEAAIGNKEVARVKTTEGLNPKAAWVYFASGHKSNSMLPKAAEGITVNWLVPSSVSPYAAAVGKSYSIVRIRKINQGDGKND
jgi:thiosulfate reductase/polysulfide reductase chain A